MNDLPWRELGLMLASDLTPSTLIEFGQMAEDLGYTELWYTDHRFSRDCYSGLALVAQHTERIRVGPGVNDPFTRHPALIAMAIATLDEITGGRAQLGLGTGGSGIAAMKLPKVRPVRALGEAIELIQQLLRGDVIRYEGEVFSLIDGQLGFAPPRLRIPIYVATHSPQTLRLTGRLADGVILGNMGRCEAIDRAVASLREGEQQAGRPPGSTVVNLRLETLISEDRDRAFAVMRRRMANRLITSYPNWGYLGDQEQCLDQGVAEAAGKGNQDGVERLLTDDDVTATALVGHPTEAATQLAPLLTSDVDRVTIRPYGFRGHGQDETVRLFAENVWPATIRHATNSVPSQRGG